MDMKETLHLNESRHLVKGQKELEIEEMDIQEIFIMSQKISFAVKTWCPDTWKLSAFH